MVILHILNMREYSGAENVAIHIIKSYSNDIHGVYLSPVGTIGDIVKKNDITYYGVKKLSIYSVRKAIREINPDIIHAHDYTATIIATIVSRGIPIISHIHNNLPWMKNLSIKSFIAKTAMNRVNYCLAVSSSVFNEAWFNFKNCCNCQVVGNPVNVNEIRNKKIKDFQSDLVFVGRLTEQKNPIEFLKIVKLLKEDRLNVNALMVGDGILREQCEIYIKENKLNDNVTMCGFVNDPYDYMSKNSILVIPSLWEGFGLVAVEALSLGVPVVATAVGGLSDIIDDSCGCCSDSFEKRLTMIKTLIVDKAKHKEKSIGASRRAIQLDNSNSYISTIEEIYKSVI